METTFNNSNEIKPGETKIRHGLVVGPGYVKEYNWEKGVWLMFQHHYEPLEYYKKAWAEYLESQKDNSKNLPEEEKE